MEAEVITAEALPSVPAEPEADLTKALVQESAKRGLVILPCGVRGNVIRFLVPLTASDAIINEGMGAAIALEVWVKKVLPGTEEGSPRFKVTEAIFTYVAIDDVGRPHPVHR